MEYSPVTGLGRLDFTLVRYTDTQAHRHTGTQALLSWHFTGACGSARRSVKAQSSHTYILVGVPVTVGGGCGCSDGGTTCGDGGRPLPLVTAVVIVVSANTGTL